MTGVLQRMAINSSDAKRRVSGEPCMLGSGLTVLSFMMVKTELSAYG